MIKNIAVLTAIFISFTSGLGQAKVYIDLSAPSERRMPVAIGEFRELLAQGALPQDPSGAIGAALAQTLRGDLVFSGLFSIMDAKGITEKDFGPCRSIGADTLVAGGYTVDKDRLSLEVRLLDCVAEKVLLYKRYIGSTNNPRRLIHYFADQLYESLTGRKGVFSTKILFVSNLPGNKEIFSADYDGGNVMQLTRNKHINLSPQWSPDGRKVIYSSYKNGEPNLYMFDMRSGKDARVSSRPGINVGGRFSPDGTRIALTLSAEKSPELYILTLATGEYTRLTDNYGIDVSPTWSPDGQRIAYTSDISGNPHIFVIDLTTGKSVRQTFEGKYNSSPAWSPDGAYIAYARADGGAFQIWAMDVVTGSARQLTFQGNNQSPSWSPDGRHIIFSNSNNDKGSLYVMHADGTGLRKVITGIGNESSPAWSPYLQ
ncbi:MAG: Tol-Pal system beta propeller repeat protein TolB [Deltaproteobacteria bacterium]|nr:Tol-Pal system beta propeller repeat protein TolB [Deltaproteobacteria bacterium]